MDKFDRIYQLHQILSARRTPISWSALAEHLECSRATVFRLIARLRDFLGAPIVSDGNGYRYAREKGARAYSAKSSSTNVRDSVKPHGASAARLGAATGGRPFSDGRQRHLAMPASAHRLSLAQQGSSGRGPFLHNASLTTATPGTSMPGSSAPRAPEFSIDRINHAIELDESAEDIPEARLDEHFASAYGIFADKADKTAILRFSAERARSVTDECWHPQQAG